MADVFAGGDDEPATHTQGKHDFNSLYNSFDPSLYMREMKAVKYEIAENAAAITSEAIRHLFSGSASASSDGDDSPTTGQHVVLELCAGYGLSMAPLRTTLRCHEILDQYSTDRCGSLDAAAADDCDFFARATRSDLPGVQVVGVDIAENALT